MFDYQQISDLNPFYRIAEFSFSLDQKYREPVRTIVKKSLELGSEAWGAYNESSLVAGYVLDEYSMRFRESPVKMGGIGFVCTRADYRGKGAVKFLLKESLKTMREKGHVVSVLYPFNQGFYRKYGWELFFRMKKVKFSPGTINLPDEDNTISPELLEAPDEESLDFYNAYARDHYNFCPKTIEYWKMSVTHPWPDIIARNIVKFTEDDRVVGIMDLSYSREGKDRKQLLSVRQFLHLTENARRAMLGFIKSLSQQIDEVVFTLPLDEELWPYLSDRPKEQLIQDAGMIRIVSLEDLDGLSIKAPDLDIAVRVEDSLAPWNDGIFRFIVESGTLSVRRADKHEFQCDVSTLSSIISGFTDLREMQACGRVKPGERSINVDFPKQVTLLMEFF